MPLSPEQRGTLLLIARRAVEASVCSRQPPCRVTGDPVLDVMLCGVFVTIKTDRLAGDAWRNGDVEVFRFTAEVFEEPHCHEVSPVAIGYFIVQTN